MLRRGLWVFVLSLVFTLVLTSCSFDNHKVDNDENRKMTDPTINESSETYPAIDKTNDSSETLTETDSQVETQEEYLQMRKNDYDYFGYIIIEDNILYIDPIELITTEDVDRITELGLNEQYDMPSGYYFYNPDNDLISFQITDETEFHFIDSNYDFLDEEEHDNPFAVTKDVNIFIAFLETYGDYAATYPFFIVLDGDCVKYVIEEFAA